jgi:hypothetical protein
MGRKLIDEIREYLKILVAFQITLGNCHKLDLRALANLNPGELRYPRGK